MDEWWGDNFFHADGECTCDVWWCAPDVCWYSWLYCAHGWGGLEGCEIFSWSYGIWNKKYDTYKTFTDVFYFDEAYNL